MRESIKDKVAIVGMGCTRFGERWDASAGDMIVEAAIDAFEDAGVEPKDIQAAWAGTLWTGITGMTVGHALKLQYVPITRVENACCTGTEAVRNAAYAVASGVYDLVLAVGYEKIKDLGTPGVPMAQGSGTPTQVFPQASAPGLFAMLATRYFARYGLSRVDGKTMLAKISVKSHDNGSTNPKAHLRRKVTVEQVLAAPIIAWPLGLFDCCGTSDGAAAAILTRADMAKSFRNDPVYIKALQIAVGFGAGDMRCDYDYTHVEEAYRAGQAAYAEAGVTNPRQQISMAEVHDCFSITEAIVMEDLGFSPRGKVKEDIEAGTFLRTGDLPVQPDGGLKCFGHPVGATGVRMIYECYLQLRGKAGERQIKNPKLGLTHNQGGQPPSAAVAVSIVGGEKG